MVSSQYRSLQLLYSMSVAPVALILGAGRGIGQSVGAMLKSKGYKVALASRNPSESLPTEGYLPIKFDLAYPYSLDGLFAKVEKDLGQPASVVIYNGTLSLPPAF
jgi:NAD(P)-dependent dehydrogenase (short-subunit alcohol dehydrogenase family)